MKLQQTLISEGLRAVKEGSIEALVYDAPILRYLIHQEFKGGLEVLQHTFRRENYGIALPKGSALRESINSIVLEKIHGHEWQDILHQYLGGSFDLGYRDEEIPNDLETNLNEIISPFYRTLSANYAHLTPKEIQVADLVKRGKTTKEIGEIMNSSARAIEFHRINIRKKLGLANKKPILDSTS